MSTPTQLWGRKAQLIVTPSNATSSTALNAATATGTADSPFTFSKATSLPALDLSEFRFKFDIYASDVATPNMAIFRVYNLGQNTINTIIKEYTEVAIQAGYEQGANYGTIFQGNITQLRRGQETNVDSYLEIHAADGDVEYNFGFSSFPLLAGSTPANALQLFANSVGLSVDPQATALLNETGGVLPRGAVSFGPTKWGLYALAKQSACRWSIQNGVIKLIPLTGYLPGEAVVLNSATGMVGIPEATDEGVKVRCLLNPRIQIGQRIQINERDITTDYITKQFYGNQNTPNQNAPKDGIYTANVTRDGFYRVMVANHTGDTRDVPWYTDIICLAIDPTAASNIVNPNYSIDPDYKPSVVDTLGTVKAYGG